MKRPALLLIDMQRDFLDRGELIPSADMLVEQAAALLGAWRAAGFPVIHVHTLVCADGSNRMPHWVKADYWACVEATPGAAAPTPLAPLTGEQIARKTFFSAFGDPNLASELARLQVDSLVLAGIFLHGCVRATAFDAYERGFEVWIASDAVGSNEPLHGEISRAYLEGRAAHFLPTRDILDRFGHEQEVASRVAPTVPAGYIGHAWQHVAAECTMQHHDPCDRQAIVAAIPIANAQTVALGANAARQGQATWANSTIADRLALLERWQTALQANASDLAAMLASEIGKPILDAQEEIGRAQSHIASAARHGAETVYLNTQVRIRYCPVGRIGLLTPWNNPVAIPLGKLASAVMFGNAVLWKPAMQATRTSVFIMELLIQAGTPPGIVNMVFGDKETARAIIEHPDIDAISLTGSVTTGRSAQALCALYCKPLQAELGGNNAVIVLPDADLDVAAHGLALSAYGFAGQRCTAVRRFIVHRAIADAFVDRMIAAIRALRLGYPSDPATQVGPLVSCERLLHVEAVIQEAVASGAKLLCGGRRPTHLPEHGNWLEPALLLTENPGAAVVQEETFGPVAVVLVADDLSHAIELANHVPHGLVAGLLSDDPAARTTFTAKAQAGILKLAAGPLPIHPEAPFGGWKASRVGPPEHGRWDREFFARPQVIYQ